jgi:hypothetical protein
MLTVSQAAERYRIIAKRDISEDRIRKIIVAGGLKAERLGLPPKGMYMIEEADLEAFAKLDRPAGKRKAKAITSPPPPPDTQDTEG